MQARALCYNSVIADNCSGADRDARALIGRGLRHIFHMFSRGAKFQSGCLTFGQCLRGSDERNKRKFN